MNRATVTALHRRLLANLHTGATDTCANETRIPATAFTDPEQLTRERESLFLATPQPVAFSGEVADPCSYMALDILGIPVLLSRDEDRRLHAFINACAHRGAQVASGSGNARSFNCPFHGWTYKHNGSLRGRPGEEHFASTRESCGLTPLPVSEKHGIIVVGLRSDVSQASVDTTLSAPGESGELGDDLDGFNFSAYRALERREMSVAANWKLVNDLSLESYHFATLHRDSVAAMLAPNAVVDTWQRHSRWAFPLKSIDHLAGQEETDWPDTLQGSVTYTLYPGVMLLVNALGAQMIRAEPGDSPDLTKISYVGMYAPGSDRDAALQAYRFGGDVFAGEDLPAAEECQRGLAARGGDYPLGKNEPLLQFWHQLWEQTTRPG